MPVYSLNITHIVQIPKLTSKTKQTPHHAPTANERAIFSSCSMTNWAKQCYIIPWAIKAVVFDSPNVCSTYMYVYIDIICHRYVLLFCLRHMGDPNMAMYHISIEQEDTTWLSQFHKHTSCSKDDRSVKAKVEWWERWDLCNTKTAKILHVFDIYGSFPSEITVFMIALYIFFYKKKKTTKAIHNILCAICEMLIFIL